MSRLLSLYLHAMSFLLIGFAQYMSIRYVQLEQQSGGDIVLDDFVKLERHGFHFLAQIMIGLTISCLLHIRSDLARASLAVFCVPIVARMCGCPVEKLMSAHNISIAGAMLIISFYLLNSAPSLLNAIRRAYKQFEAIIFLRGIVTGSVTIWRRLHIPQLLTTAWVTSWCLNVFVEISNRTLTASIFEYPIIGLSAVAECTVTTLSLIGLATTVSYASEFILLGSRLCLIGNEGRLIHDAAYLSMRGYSEGLTLFLLSVQTGLIGMQPAQRAFLLGVVLFIVLSALLQSLFELMEPHLLSLGASHHQSIFRHIRALFLSFILFIGPFTMVYGIIRFLALDLWCLIIISNCLLTSLQTFSTVAVYALFLIEARSTEPWEKLDDFIFCCRATTRAFEFLLAVAVIGYGVYESIFGRWSLMSALVLSVHCYFNVWSRLQSGWKTFQLRRTAADSIRVLAKASQDQLKQLHDRCSICYTDMVLEARITPCGHFFHGTCLRKWLFVKQTCPMCHSDLSARRNRKNRAQMESEEGYSSEWETEEESNSTETEYTLASSEN